MLLASNVMFDYLSYSNKNIGQCLSSCLNGLCDPSNERERPEQAGPIFCHLAREPKSNVQCEVQARQATTKSMHPQNHARPGLSARQGAAVLRYCGAYMMLPVNKLPGRRRARKLRFFRSIDGDPARARMRAYAALSACLSIAHTGPRVPAAAGLGLAHLSQVL